MSDKSRLAFGIAVMILFGAALFALVKFQLPDANNDAIMLLVGGINTLAAMVVGYYFGSSDGSKAKTAMMSSKPDGTPEDPVHVDDREIE